MGEEAIPFSYCPPELFVLVFIFYFQLVVGTYMHLGSLQHKGVTGPGRVLGGTQC